MPLIGNNLLLAVATPCANYCNSQETIFSFGQVRTLPKNRDLSRAKSSFWTPTVHLLDQATCILAFESGKSLTRRPFAAQLVGETCGIRIA
jgi:hypothetical protein